MTTTDSVLRSGLAEHGDELRLTLDPRFAGLPQTAHGGTVLAAFQAVARIVGAQDVQGHYRRRVPLGTPLRLAVARDNAGATCRLVDDADAVLVEGGVHPTADAPAVVATPGAGGDPLPVSSTCFACGLDNPIGLQLRLRVDEASVWGRWIPRETAAAADGTLAPIALTALLDETAFWLGALASGESGMTTEVSVTLHRTVGASEPIVVAGARSRTRVLEDERFWQTEVTAADVGGNLVATGRITFVAVRGSARRLVTGLSALNPPETLRRVFPAYAR